MRIALAAALAVGLVGVAAGCGKTPLDDLDEGENFEIGEVRLNVAFDRFLNVADTEDADYLQGQPPPPTGKDYFAVFLRLENEGGEEVPAPSITSFQVEDTTGTVYRPLQGTSPYEFPYATPIEADGEIPDPDSVAAQGPIQGSMVLFLVDEAVSESRPLTFRIRYLGAEARVKLDL